MPNRLLAVIGTAGRKDDADRINAALYDAMYAETLRAMADWAVRAFLEGEATRLVLRLPAPFVGGQYVRPSIPMDNDAQTANRYHKQFSEKCRLDSLGEIKEAIARGAEVHVGRGFKARNLDVAADATHLLALTFGTNQEPVDLTPDMEEFSDALAAGLKDGGTAHTYSQAWRCDLKRHVSLNWLIRRPELAVGGPHR